MATILLFSDVDGTVLGRDGRYAVTAEELAPWLPRVDIVLASSRTVRELVRNQRDLGIEGPVVAENGAIAAFPWQPAAAIGAERALIDGHPWWVSMLGWPADRLRAQVQRAAAHVGIAYVDQDHVEPGLGRVASVLVRPDGPHRDMAALAPLATELRRVGCTVASGGDWLAVTGSADKDTGARAVRQALTLAGHRYTLVAAVGNGDNDLPLLHAAERGYVISCEDGSWHPALDAHPGSERVVAPGIAGWRELVRRLARFADAADATISAAPQEV
jgi:mannosyl-3-phosphoglycerate phosphatase